MDTPQVLLEHHLKALRLPTFVREYDKVAQQCAAEGVDFPRYLLRLTELELLDRERRATERRIHQARFDVVKSLDSFDFLALPSLNKALVLELARGEFIERKENILALGNSGTGKTHIALALGLAACQKGFRVRFTTPASLAHELRWSNFAPPETAAYAALPGLLLLRRSYRIPVPVDSLDVGHLRLILARRGIRERVAQCPSCSQSTASTPTLVTVAVE